MIDLRLGDCLDVMRTMDDESVHCCVTSPPYFGLRDYGADGQIGLEKTPDEYVARMVEVFREVRRVLRDDGTLWLNLGDSYNTRAHGPGCVNFQAGAHNDAFQSKFAPGFVRVKDLKNKDLLGIPWRVAFALQADGAADPKAVRIIARLRDAIHASYEAWEDVPAPVRHELARLDAEYAQAKAGSWYLRSDIIWHKPNPMPESVRDRPTKAHEYLFLLSKSERYHYDADAIKEGGSGRAAQNRKPMKGEGMKGFEIRDGFRKVADVEWHTRNRRSVWTVATRPFKGAHFATFPVKLIEPCVLAGTSEAGCCPACGKPWERVVEKVGKAISGKPRGENAAFCAERAVNGPVLYRNVTEDRGFRPDCSCNAGSAVPCTVLDPFNGAGTTGVVAKQHGRDYVGIELNPDYLALADARIEAA